MSHRVNSVFANPGVSSQCAGLARDFFLENAISALKLYANETNSEAHYSLRYVGALSDTPVFQPELFDEQTATKLLLLTSNVLVRGGGARSAGESPPLAG